MSVTWTQEQSKVIEVGHRNLLVSAAAGSGKTAVLVERIIQMLTRPEQPVDVDELLVVTFTEAAAAEMKERIRAAIEKKVDEDPENENLRRQATLIHSARITTIHSFCLSVVREHFHVLGIDPAFRIGEEGELNLLRQDVLAAVMEEAYQEGTKEFLDFVESYGTGKSDAKIEDMIQKLYEFSRSYPDPDEWLEDCIASYRMDTEEVFQESAFYKRAVENTRRYLSGVEELLDEAERICEQPDGPYMYADMLESDREVVRSIAQAQSYEAFVNRFHGVKWARLAPNRDQSVSSEKTEQVKRLRDDVKKMVKELEAMYFSQSLSDVLDGLGRCLGMMEQAVRLVRAFASGFEEAKRARNMIDFDDMQQYALRILTEKTKEGFRPSVVSTEYQKQFAEVMIDEYQDSNLIQEAILTSVSRGWSGKNNLFMVGDVKQSIYRFRLSRPELFMEKYDTYGQEDGACQRIDLRKNFRSRPEVLDAVNAVFRKIMKKSLGGIVYDDDAALYVGAKYAPVNDNTAELILIPKQEDEEEDANQQELTRKEREGLVLAARIRELMEHQLVTDRGTGELRPVRYKDIVILTRSIQGYADVFAQVLHTAGIPAYTGKKEGYFETQEIGLFLDYLRIMNNRRQDIPLAAVLKSCFVGLSEEDLARIRGQFREMQFHEAVWSYKDEGDVERIRAKLNAFFAQIEQFREQAGYLALHELIRRILEETGYMDYMRAFADGGQREVNLLMLLERAKQFEATSYKGVFHFIRYIEKMKKYEIDYGEANTLGEEADAVRIMSIHKSKGLEFPVVIVAGMGKGFNRMDSGGDVVMHASLGVGLTCVDLEKRTKTPSFLKQVIAREEYLESMGEELRVLYVALTRAKEKLIMTGIADEPERWHKEVFGFGDHAISFMTLAKAGSYLDWLYPVIRCIGTETPIAVKISGAKDARRLHANETAGRLFERMALEQIDTETVYDEEMRRHMEEQFEFRYPHGDLEGKKLKYTVSELKKRAYLGEESGELLVVDEPVVPLIPRFLREEESLSGASRGSAYHRVMELLDFVPEYDVEAIRAAISRMREAGRISKEMADCIRAEDVHAFFRTDCAARMRTAAAAGKLWKEQPFVLGIGMEEMEPVDSDAASGVSGETVLVQGIIDVYFEEEDGLVVLDYKTDRVRTAGELLEKYRTQLDYYARALEQITGKPVRQKIIYSFTLEEEIAWV